MIHTSTYNGGGKCVRRIGNRYSKTWSIATAN